MKNELIAANGSVQALDVPQEVKDLYKTTWEIKQKVLIDMAADRAQHPSSSACTFASKWSFAACVFGCCTNTLRLLVGKTRAVTNECRLL